MGRPLPWNYPPTNRKTAHEPRRMNAPPTTQEPPTAQPNAAQLEAELLETRALLKYVEEELRRKTAFNDAFVNSSLDGILVVDNEGRKILQNQQMIDLWKIPQNIAEE